MPKAIDLMNTNLVSVEPDDPVEEAIYRMLRHKLTSLPVISPSGELLGIISEFDLLDLVWEPKAGNGKVYQHMTRRVHSVEETTDLSEVAEQFRILSIRRLPVMREGQLVGMIDRQDLLAQILRNREQVVPTGSAVSISPCPATHMSVGF